MSGVGLIEGCVFVYGGYYIVVIIGTDHRYGHGYESCCVVLYFFFLFFLLGGIGLVVMVVRFARRSKSGIIRCGRTLHDWCIYRTLNMLYFILYSVQLEGTIE